MEEKAGPLRGMNATVYNPNKTSNEIISVVLFSYVLLFAFMFAVLGWQLHRSKLNRTRKQGLGSLSV